MHKSAGRLKKIIKNKRVMVGIIIATIIGVLVAFRRVIVGAIAIGLLLIDSLFTRPEVHDDIAKYNEYMSFSHDIAPYKDDDNKWAKLDADESIWPESITDSMNVIDYKMVYYNPWDPQYLGYLVVEYEAGAYANEIKRLQEYKSTDYIGYYDVREETTYEIAAVNANSYHGFVYALTDGKNRIIYGEQLFCNYYMDLEYEKYIPEEYLLDGFNATQNSEYYKNKLWKKQITKVPEIEIEISADGKGCATYDGIKHNYILDLPENVKGAPLVMLLHGYGGSAEAFKTSISFEKEANARGYAVIYVTGASSPEDPTSASGWNSGIGASSNKDVEFLCSLADSICEDCSLDRSRIFVAGFSNGAFMAHRLALEANDTFSAVVSVAGMMPESIWENRPDTCQVGFLQITGQKDDVVPKNSDGSAKYAKAPAIEDVMAYYVDKNNLTSVETGELGKKSLITKYTSDDTKKQVWDVFIPDGRHSWPDESIVGFNTNSLILDFLDTQ